MVEYVELEDSYKSLNESLLHASIHNQISLIKFIDSEDIKKSNMILNNVGYCRARRLVIEVLRVKFLQQNMRARTIYLI